MIIGSPMHGVQLSGPSAPPFNPLTDIPDLLRFMWAKPPFTKTTTVPLVDAVVGDTVQSVYMADGLAIGGIGFPDMQGFYYRMPTLQPDGLQYGISDSFMQVQDSTSGFGSVTQFTAWLVGTQVDNNSAWVPLGASVDHTNGNSLIAVLGNILTVQDDDANNVNGATPVTGGLVLVRVNADGSGNVSFNATGMTSYGTGTGFSAFVFDITGESYHLSIPNGDTGNRHLLQIVTGVNYTEGSTLDNQVRAWILANTGASL